MPPLAFQVVILSPLPAIRKFRAEGSTGSVSPVPYAAMCANGAIWCTYGLMTDDPTIWAPNSASSMRSKCRRCEVVAGHRRLMRLHLEAPGCSTDSEGAAQPLIFHRKAVALYS